MPGTKSRIRRIAELASMFFALIYILAILMVWLLIRVQGDYWWLATLFVYGPRWIYFVPLVLLGPAAWLMRPKMLVPLGLCGCVALFSLMGFNIPWRNLGVNKATNFRVLSYNVKQRAFPGHLLEELVALEIPDVIALQEDAGPIRRSNWWQSSESWHVAKRGELAVLSKYPIKQVETSFSNWPPQRHPLPNAIYCVLSTPQGEVGFCNLHIDTPRRALDQVLDRDRILVPENAGKADFRLECRRNESRDLLRWLQQFPQPKIIAGDFNTTPDSPLFRRDWSQLRSAFQWAGWGLGYTKQTVIRRRKYGLRIDHILTDENLVPTRCWIGPDLGSDHLPLFAEFALKVVVDN